MDERVTGMMGCGEWGACGTSTGSKWLIVMLACSISDNMSYFKGCSKKITCECKFLKL